MIYRVFSKRQEQLAEVRDASWPLIKVDEHIPIMVDGKEALYKVIEVGEFNISRNNKLVVDIWVE